MINEQRYRIWRKARCHGSHHCIDHGCTVPIFLSLHFFQITYLCPYSLYIHVGRDVDGFFGVHSGNGFGDCNAEGEAILEFATSFDLVVANTFFTKEMQKLVTYESGGVSSVVNYVLTRKKT